MKPMTRLKKLKKKLDSMTGCDKQDKKDELLGLWEIMRGELKKLLDDDLAVLAMSKNDLILFISYCSTHRPQEPHSILSRIGTLSKLSQTRIELMKMVRDWGTDGIESIRIVDETIKVVYEDGFRPFINRVVYFDRYMRIVHYEN